MHLRLSLKCLILNHSKTTGIVITIAGPVIMAAGIGILAGWDERGAPVFLTGLAATTVGIPILVSGSHRVKRVNNALYAQENVNIIDGPGYINNQNPGQFSQVDLNNSLRKAQILKTTGLVMTIAGPVFFVAGVVMGIGWVDGSGAVLATGFVSTVAGIPILIVGSKKVNKIEKTMSTHNKASLSIAPGFVRTNINQSLYPGATLKFSF